MRRDDDSDNYDDDDNESLLLEFTPIRHRGNIKIVIFTKNINLRRKKRELQEEVRSVILFYTFYRIYNTRGHRKNGTSAHRQKLCAALLQPTRFLTNTLFPLPVVLLRRA